MKQQRETLGYTAGSLAEAIDSPRQQVDHAIKMRELKAIKSGRRWIILKEDAIAWLKRCREQGEIPSPVTAADKQKLAALNRARRGKGCAMKTPAERAVKYTPSAQREKT